MDKKTTRKAKQPVTNSETGETRRYFLPNADTSVEAESRDEAVKLVIKVKEDEEVGDVSA